MVIRVDKVGAISLETTTLVCHQFAIKPDSCADPEGGTGGLDPLKNYKNIGFLSNSGPDPLKNYEATEPALNVEPSSARQRNAI